MMAMVASGCLWDCKQAVEVQEIVAEGMLAVMHYLGVKVEAACCLGAAELHS